MLLNIHSTLFSLFFTIFFVFFSTKLSSSASPAHLEYILLEGREAFTTIANIKIDSNATHRFTPKELKRLGFHLRHTHLFTIGEKDGILMTKDKLERKVVCKNNKEECRLTFDVLLRVSPSNHQVLKVAVVLKDLNEIPSFPHQEFDLFVIENSPIGTTFPIPKASDPDFGNNGIQKYSLAENSTHFQLVNEKDQNGEIKPKLVLDGKLDREKLDNYKLIVIATDGGKPPLSSSMVLNIKVTDANDNKPSFKKPVYYASVPENLPSSSLVTKVEATDPDEGENAKVVYSFSEQTEKSYGDLFWIDQSSGEIFTKGSLDFESDQLYTLTVQAKDQGIGSLPEFTKVIINVNDLNDNKPEIHINLFSDSDLNPSVHENVPVGSFVAHLSVSDADESGKQLFHCQIDDLNNFSLVNLNDSEYTIITNKTFDREKISTYRVLFTCLDSGTPPLKSHKVLEVEVADENDNNPILSPNSKLKLYTYELNKRGLLITKVNATDLDSGRNAMLHYSLEPYHKSDANVLNIDPVLGRITANVVFDFEKQKIYKFKLKVSDKGEPPRSVTDEVVLHILDTNDEAPQFEKPSYYLSVPENNPSGSLVGTVKATDADASESFNKIQYKILSSEDAFEINENSGEILNLKRLDREEQDLYKFQVVAFNPGVQSEESRVNVTVYVDDINDNSPLFLFPTETNNQVQVSADAKPGTLVTRLVASDADIGANAELVFTISNGNVDNSFNIDPTTGVITVAKKLRSQDKQDRIHRLVVSVSDLGSPPLTAVDDLNILVNSSILPRDEFSALTSKLSEKHIIVIISIIIFFIFFFICLFCVLICLKRRRRKRRNERGKYVVTRVLDTYDSESTGKTCRSPNCNQNNLISNINDNSNSTMDCRKLGGASSSITVDSSSTRSDCNCPRPIPPPPPPTLMCRDEEEDLEVCRIHEPSVMANSWDPSQNIRITPGGEGHSQAANGVRCSSATCRGFGISASCCHRPPQTYNCCNLPCHSPHNQCYQHPNMTGTMKHQPPPQPFNSRPPKRSLYSPESIPLQPVARVGINLRDQDIESVCSGSTWTDSGRGPSEEDDHLKSHRIENFLRTTQAN